MMKNRPHFKEYVMARLVTIAVIIFILFSLLLVLLIDDNETVVIAIFIIALAFSLFIYAIYHGAARMQKELMMINKHLSNIDKVTQIEYKARFLHKSLKISINTLQKHSKHLKNGKMSSNAIMQNSN